MKLLKIRIDKRFRSLHSGFEIDFHNLTEKGKESMEEFRPFCFAGLNGSGKSNLLEATAAIFYHLEFCVAKFRPKKFELCFYRDKCIPDGFYLEYLIGDERNKSISISNFTKVTVQKRESEEPQMWIQKYPFDESIKKEKISLIPTNNEPANGKLYLPDIVVGYSSGENEILSLPFLKNRLVHFDEYREAYQKFPFDEPESSLIYIDSEMSQAVLLSSLIFEDLETTLKPLKDELGIQGLRSFRMNLKNQVLELINRNKKSAPILEHIDNVLNDLKKCSTSWHESEFQKNEDEEPISLLVLDFYINKHSKKIFKEYFKTSFRLFRFFQVLYELNSNIIDDSIKEEVYNSKGFYTDGKLPVPAPKDTVFHFLDFKIIKDVNGKGKIKDLLLREFSDGEHQFLHTIGICLMLKARRTLLLLDEPETHFNPSWRAKFIKILNDSITKGSQVKGKNKFNVHLQKDIILTSHSPFIISDCLPNNVIYFEKNKDTDLVEARSAKDIGFNTFGTSIELILDELFDYNQSIGDWSMEKLETIKFDKLKTSKDIEAVKKDLRILGESIEKDLVLAKLNKLDPKKK